MKDYEYLKNAYWEKDDKSLLKCIRLTKRAEGGRKKDVLVFSKIRKDGTPCPNYREVIESVGLETIDKNTVERREKKSKEDQEKKAIVDQKRKSAELEQLFNMKLQAFEIQEIKESPDRDLRTRMRRAKNPVELYALAALIIGNSLGYYAKKDDEVNDDRQPHHHFDRR